VFGLDALKLDGNLLAGNDVGAEIDITKTATSDLAADPVLVTDAKVLVWKC
jgi:hypothetical protein